MTEGDGGLQGREGEHERGERKMAERGPNQGQDDRSEPCTHLPIMFHRDHTSFVRRANTAAHDQKVIIAQTRHALNRHKSDGGRDQMDSPPAEYKTCPLTGTPRRSWRTAVVLVPFHDIASLISHADPQHASGLQRSSQICTDLAP